MQNDRDQMLDEYFELCKRTYEQMEREGCWPWESDSTKLQDSVDSDSNKNIV